MAVEWKFYYLDGSTFSSLDGSYEEAPQDGVIGYAYADPVYGRRVHNHTEFYFQPPGEEPMSTDDIRPTLKRLFPWIKFGIIAGDKQYEEIKQRMFNDPDFPVKSPRRRSTDG